jgi:phospholipid/cholesterol/gamma-HCH transport system ATP-binding protein
MNDERDPIIVLDHVSKSFGSKPVLRDISLSVERGEALCILGRSGTGKSVTLKLMIALLRPEAGQIRISGESITELESEQLSHIRRKMGFLFQSGALFDSLTLHDNLALPLIRLTTKSKDEIENVVDRMLSEVGLASDKSKMPVELSGGMKKRAGLARALVLEPEILLVDEPSSGLDRITASEIDDLLLEQKTKRKATMVIVTHDARGARRVGDRFAVLDRGCLLAFGTAAELDHHENAIVQKLFEEP